MLIREQKPQKIERARKLYRRRRALKSLTVMCALVLGIVLCVWGIKALVSAGSQPEAVPAAGEASALPENPGASRASAISRAPSPTPAPTPIPPQVQLEDPLLVLVNSEVAVPKDWKTDLCALGGEEKIDARAYNSLQNMIADAWRDGIELWVASSYRSVEDQKAILERGVANRMANGMTEKEAREDAARTIQAPEHSEHHTGLAVDFNDVNPDFEKTAEYQWLSKHAAEYGFVQRYRSDKVKLTGIDNESWHYRYVGKEYAQEMQRLNMCLEEYVAYRKEQGAPVVKK